MASSSASATGATLFSHHDITMSGSAPATRVPSRNEPAASDSVNGPPSSPTTASAYASKCGMCEIRATARSWLSAVAGITSERTNLPSATTSRKVLVHSSGTSAPAAAASAARSKQTTHAAPS